DCALGFGVIKRFREPFYGRVFHRLPVRGRQSRDLKQKDSNLGSRTVQSVQYLPKKSDQSSVILVRFYGADRQKKMGNKRRDITYAVRRRSVILDGLVSQYILTSAGLYALPYGK